MRHLLLLLPLALLLGCPPAGGDDDDSNEEPTPAPRPGPGYSLGDCPTLEAGDHGFDTALAERRVRIDLPDEPEGAPVVFVWHWLGGSPDEIMEYIEFEDLVDEGAIVIAPYSSGLQFEWAFLAPPEDNVDLQVFEDLLTCAQSTWNVDMDRIYATGMSAGGLMTSYLLLHEAQWLAAAAPLSGGANASSYVTPARLLPVLLTWGGVDDFAVGFDFNAANIEFSELLQDDFTWVGECVHDDGHVPPDGAKDYIWEFFEDHPFDLEEEPYADGLPDSFPDFCALPE